MVLTENLAQLLDMLLNSREPLTSSVMAEQIGVSQRSIFTYLKELKYIIEKCGYNLVNRPGVGIFIDTDSEGRLKIKSAINVDIDYSLSYKARRDHIIGTLARTNDSYTIQLLADDLFVSKTVIIKDINYIEAWLKNHNVELIRKKNFGLALKGEELDIRKAVLYHRAQHTDRDPKAAMRRPKELDYRIKLSFWDRIQEMYPRLDLLKIQTILKSVDTTMEKSTTVESFSYVMEFLALMLTRIKMGATLVHLPFLTDEMDGSIENRAAKSILEEISRHFDVRINRFEVYYLTACLKCMDYQYSEEETDTLYVSCEKKYKDMADKLIQMVCDMINVDINNDRTLKKQLTIFLMRFNLRKKYGIEIKSIMHQEIKNTFSGILGVCFSATSVFESLDENVFDEGDVANIAMIFCNALFRLKKRYSALIITAVNQSMTNYLANKIISAIPDLQIQMVVPFGKLDLDSYEEADIVICIDSSVDMNNAVNVSRMVTDYEIELIKKKLHLLKLDSTLKSKNGIQPVHMVKDRLIIQNAACKTKAEAIALGCEKLFEASKVEAGFLEDVMHRESFAPTAIGNGVAIPHGSSDYVNHFSMCLIRLRKYIAWTEEDKVDLVFVLALTQSELQSFNSFFSNFYTVVNDKNALKRIRETESSKEIEKFFFQNAEEI